MTTRFVDIHCHILPGIDDGATDWDESLAMARLAAADGIATIIATPHQLGTYSHNTSAQIRQLVAELQDRLDQSAIELRVLPGADVRIEPDLVAKTRTGDILTLADGGRFVLLELPHEVYVPLEPLLDELARAGLQGILSHPERNRALLASPHIIAELVDCGCWMQVTASSLLGAFGKSSQRLAEWMLAEGLVHFVATDAHGAKSRRPLMHRAYDRVQQLVGTEVARLICCLNPQAVVRGEQPTVVRAAVGRRRRAIV